MNDGKMIGGKMITHEFWDALYSVVAGASILFWGYVMICIISVL